MQVRNNLRQDNLRLWGYGYRTVRAGLRLFSCTMLMSVIVMTAMLLPDWGTHLRAEEQRSASRKATSSRGTAKRATAGANPFPKRIPAPSLEGGTGWLNTAGELSLRDLKGKVVLLDFWTYCCINCMHILPDLTYLEEKYADQLVVIGVHSGKFRAEKDSENIRQAIMRYEIAHPVINDANMTLWNKFNVSSWPTFVLIDPEGNVCGALAGEGNRDNLDKVIGRVVSYHRANGTLDESPLHFDLESGKRVPTPLQYPGKVLADEAGNRLFISDSNHSRIVITDLSGKLLDVVGSGQVGRTDGPYDQAQFDHPQGMCLDQELLYVADTENHLLRVVDLQKKTVRTIAGTGKQSRAFHSGGKPLQVALASPWDVLKIGNRLFVAMAGFHQIWVMTGNETIRPFAGSGKEDILNGPLMRSALAQPSGLCTDGEFLYVVDSEGSAIRKIGLKSGGQVTTLVGTFNLPNGSSLFQFGDIDGIGNQARLQHPLGIDIRDGQLYVADAYNNKVKRIDISQRSSQTFLPAGPVGGGGFGPSGEPIGTGGNNRKGAELELNEPGGLSLAGEQMFIADTNNHRVRVYDFRSKQLKTLEITGLTPPAPPQEESIVDSDSAIKLPPQKIAATGPLEIRVDLAVPVGQKINPELPVTYRIDVKDGQALIDSAVLNQTHEIQPADDQSITIQIPLQKQQTGEVNVILSVQYAYCQAIGTGGLCKLRQSNWNLPLVIDDQGKSTVDLVIE